MKKTTSAEGLYPGHSRFARICWYVFMCPLVIMFVSCFISFSSAGEPLDRLFFTPRERVLLEKLRLSSPEPPPPLPEQDSGVADTENEPRTFTLGGIVKREDGAHTIWLNGTPYAERELPGKMELYRSPEGGELSLRVIGKDKVYLLRPGQTLDTADGHFRDAFEHEAVASVAEKASAGESTAEAELNDEPVQGVDPAPHPARQP